MKAETNSRRRTEWAELHVEDLLSAPLFRVVFRSPRTLDGTTEHEVSDFLIHHRGEAILVSQKCQGDPLKRTAAKVDLWARKNAKAAWSQLRRTLNRPPDRAIWCDHILGATKNMDRAELVWLIEPLMRGALAHNNKRRCLLIFDRGGKAYEVAIPRAEFKPSPVDYEVGERAFGRLRITDKRLELVPEG